MVSHQKAYRIVGKAARGILSQRRSRALRIMQTLPPAQTFELKLSPLLVTAHIGDVLLRARSELRTPICVPVVRALWGF